MADQEAQDQDAQDLDTQDLETQDLQALLLVGQYPIKLTEISYNSRAFVTPRLAIQIVIPHWRDAFVSEPLNGLLDQALIRSIVGPFRDYELLRQNKTGSVSYLQVPRRFFFQTPNDDGLYFSYACCAIGEQSNPRRFRCILVCNDDTYINTLLSSLRIPDDWECNDLPLVKIPLQFLQEHVSITSESLARLISRVEGVEGMVAAGAAVPLLKTQIQELHSCNTDLIKLERRWRFQSQLSSSIQEFLDMYKGVSQNVVHFDALTLTGKSVLNVYQSGGGDTSNVMDLRGKESFKTLDSDANYQKKLGTASEYDLSVLSRRIENQFTAIFNLIAQDDARATIELAQRSTTISDRSNDIAQDTLGQSTAMMTIATMTLVFLPATFISSFFSMSFFDWHAVTDNNVTKAIWVYSPW